MPEMRRLRMLRFIPVSKLISGVRRLGQIALQGLIKTDGYLFYPHLAPPLAWRGK